MVHGMGRGGAMVKLDAKLVRPSSSFDKLRMRTNSTAVQKKSSS